MLRTDDKPLEGATYYDDSGNVSEDIRNSRVYTRLKSFYIREYKGTLYKKGTTILQSEAMRYKWRKVSAACFQSYMKYLKTNQEYCYNLAERSRNE